MILTSTKYAMIYNLEGKTIKDIEVKKVVWEGISMGHYFIIVLKYNEHTNLALKITIEEFPDYMNEEQTQEWLESKIIKQYNYHKEHYGRK